MKKQQISFPFSADRNSAPGAAPSLILLNEEEAADRENDMKAARSSRRIFIKKSALSCEDTETLCEAPIELLSLIDAGEPQRFAGDRDILAWCAAQLAHSPTGAKLLEEAAEEGWSASLADLHCPAPGRQLPGGFHMDIENKRLVLDHFSMTPDALGASLYFRNALLLTFIRSLRDIDHESRFGAFEDNYPPEHVLMLERVRAADCETVTVHVAWELRGAGFAEVWRHLLGSDEGDMALIFSRFLERDPGALFDGSALAYAFRQWYADEDRIAACDHETLEALDDILMDAPENHNPFGQKELTAQEVETLGELPDGIRYLAGLGRSIMSDPFFAGMNDPVNQTHFFHLMYDLEVTMVNNVPFRDGKLARRIFPGGEIIKSRL